MEFIRGKKENFFDFLNELSKKDKIAIICHNDLDGIASAIILKEILKNKELKPKIIKFIECKGGMFTAIIKWLEKKKINKILVADIALDADYGGYKILENKFNTFAIDHHPSENEGEINILRTRSEDCAAFSLFQLAKDYFKDRNLDLSHLNELICATMIMEFSYKSVENLNFLKSFYPDLTPENAYNNSKLGDLCQKISSALICLDGKELKIFKILISNQLGKLNKYNKTAKRAMERYIQRFKKEQEFFPEKKIHFYYYTPKLRISSAVSTKLSLEKPNETFVILYNLKDKPGFVKVTSRNQGGSENVNLLMKKGVEGLENSTAGGHPRAAGGDFMKKDIEKFKQNLLR